jgi:hypothetical protein
MVERFYIEVRLADTSTASNGPHSEPCFTQGTNELIDVVPFDKKFTCSCHAGWTGSSCEISPTFSTSGDKKSITGVAVGATLGAIVGLLLLVLVVDRARGHYLSLQPHDFGMLDGRLLFPLN